MTAVTKTSGSSLLRGPWVGWDEWIIGNNGEIAGIVPHKGRTPPSSARGTDCLDQRCYRVVRGELRVEKSLDGGITYVTAWEIGGTVYDRLVSSHGGVGDPAADLASLSLVVKAVDGGHVVFVANGRDGLLYRDVTGEWRRIGIPQGGEGFYFEIPPPLHSTWWPLGAAAFVAAGVAVPVLLAGVITARTRRTLKPTRVAAILVITAITSVDGALCGRLLVTGPALDAWVGAVPLAALVLAVGLGSVQLLTSSGPATQSVPMAEGNAR